MGLFKKSEKDFERDDFNELVSVLPKSVRFMNKSSLKEAESYLKADEKPLHVESVNVKKTPGVLVVTDSRMYFVLKIMGSVEFKQLPYNTISNISMKTFPIGTLVISTVHEKLEITAIHHKRVKDVYRTIMSHTS